MAAAIRRSVQFLRFNNGHRSRPLSRTAPSGCPLLGQSFEAHEYLIKARTLLASFSTRGARRKRGNSGGTFRPDARPTLTMKHLLALLVIAPLCAQTPDQLEAHGASVANTTYQGKSAVRLDALPNAANGESY